MHLAASRAVVSTRLAALLDLPATAKHLYEIRIVNGLVPGAIARAPDGADIGTVIHAD